MTAEGLKLIAEYKKLIKVQEFFDIDTQLLENNPKVKIALNLHRYKELGSKEEFIKHFSKEDFDLIKTWI